MTPARVRHPITIYVEKVEFDPEVVIDFEVIRTAYDIELNEQDMRKLYEGLKTRLEEKFPVAIRIRIIGRLVS